MIILIGILLLLSGCGKGGPIANKSVDVDIDVQSLAGYLSDIGEEGSYEIGSGVILLDEELKDSGVKAFPVYRDGTLILLAVRDDEREVYYEDDDLFGLMEGNSEHVLLSVNDGICLVSENDSYFPENTLDPEVEEMLVSKIRKMKIGRDPIGEKKETIDVKESGSDGRKDHIVIRFTEGDHEEKVGMYEEFCGGRLLMKFRTADIYVFTVDHVSEKALNSLIERSNALDYVANASVDQRNDLDPPAVEPD